MVAESEILFYEEQSFPRARLGVMLALPPAALLILAIWQVGLGHRFGRHPMSNAGVIGWTIFLWLVYLRLLTVRLVTELRSSELRIRLRGVWRAGSIPVSDIRSVQICTYDPIREYGGYGIRSGRRGKAYIARGRQGVKLVLTTGATVLVGSQQPEELANAIAQLTRSARSPVRAVLRNKQQV